MGGFSPHFSSLCIYSFSLTKVACGFIGFLLSLRDSALSHAHSGSPRHAHPVPPPMNPQFPSPLNCSKNFFGGFRLPIEILTCSLNLFTNAKYIFDILDIILRLSGALLCFRASGANFLQRIFLDRSRKKIDPKNISNKSIKKIDQNKLFKNQCFSETFRITHFKFGPRLE